jgi:hypothetical protein
MITGRNGRIDAKTARDHEKKPGEETLWSANVVLG